MESPALSNDRLTAALRAQFGLDPIRLTPLSLGADSDAKVARVETSNGHAYFLKLKIRRAGDDDLGAAVAHALAAGGLDPVVAPLPTKTGALRVDLGTVCLVLYPFVDGPTGWDIGLSPAQWGDLGRILRRLHASTLPTAIARRLPRETFEPMPRWRRVVEGLLDGSYDGPSDGEATRQLAAIVSARRGEIRRLLQRALALGQRLQDKTLPLVLCHADIHTNNVMIDRAGGLRLVDWDQPMLAPKERDLMFVIGPALNGFLPGSAEEAAFFAAYESAPPDPLALAYYRYEWAVQDIGAFAEAVVARPDIPEPAELDAVRGVQSVFHPRGIAAAAYASERDLPPG